MRCKRKLANHAVRSQAGEHPGALDPGALSASLRAGEGCQIEGHVQAQRVAGNLHVSVAMDDLFTLPETQADMRAALQAAQASGGASFLDVRP